MLERTAPTNSLSFLVTLSGTLFPKQATNPLLRLSGYTARSHKRSCPLKPHPYNPPAMGPSVAHSGDDGLKRCAWVPEAKPHYVKYHDEEWGVPPRDDNKHFELICLEGAQAGLSWETILLKREGYRAAFHGFDVKACAEMSDQYLASVVAGKMGDVVKHKGKVASVRSNAIAFLDVLSDFGSWDAYLLSFFEGHELAVKRFVHSDVPAQTPGSQELSLALKKRGFKFLGPTIAYAYMQAAGIVTDHLASCFRYEPCLEAHIAWRSQGEIQSKSDLA